MNEAGDEGPRSGPDRDEYFLELFLRHRRRIYGFILTLVRNWSDTEDVFQKTATVLWQKIDDFEPGTDFAAWALRVARLEVLGFRRQRHRDQVRFSDEAFEAVAERLTEWEESEDARRAALEGCLAKLAGRDRELIRLRYQEGASAKRIAESLGRSPPAVYKALDRIHTALLHCVWRTLASEGFP